jgi:hypothetical protein
VRDEEGAADDAQDIEFIQQVEFVGPRHRRPPDLWARKSH